MALRFTTEVTDADRKGLAELYGDEAYYRLFRDSFSKRLAYEGNTLVGAVRVISEGVETALLVDLATRNSGAADALSAGGGSASAQGAGATAIALLREIEKDLHSRRVMAYGSREYLDVFEDAGYGRCKNAWTLFRSGMRESDFLAPGYQFEGETASGDPAGKGTATYRADGSQAESQTEQKAVRTPGEIRIRSDLGEASFAEVNEVLTRAFFGRPHDENKTRRAFTNSRYTAAAYDSDRLVGVARAVADGERYATILNVAVNPEYQGLSIGKNLLRRLENDISEEVVVLNTHPGAVGFYNRLPELRRNKYVFEKFVADPAAPSRREANPGFRSRMFTEAGFRFPDEQERSVT